MVHLRIRELRQAANVSQRFLAEKLGVGQSAVSQWESGDTYPSLDKLDDLSTLLGCSIADLFDDPPEAGGKETKCC